MAANREGPSLSENGDSEYAAPEMPASGPGPLALAGPPGYDQHRIMRPLGTVTAQTNFKITQPNLNLLRAC